MQAFCVACENREFSECGRLLDKMGEATFHSQGEGLVAAEGLPTL